MGASQADPRTRPVSDAEQQRFYEVLGETVALTEDEGIPYVVAGSLCSNRWGRPSAIGDVDLIVAPQDAQRLLKRLESAGFDTEEDEPQWIYKATKSGVTVDVIFEMQGALYLDDDMIDHSSLEEIEGIKLRIMSAEDFIVSQAISTGEDTSNYWYNALAVLAATDIDWDYLVQRSSRGARRVLALLVWAQSDDRPIPDGVIRRLIEAIYGH